MTLCNATHPTTGDACSKPGTHAQATDPREQQHATANGLKWPSLHALDPSEGWNGPVPYRN